MADELDGKICITATTAGKI